MTAPANTSSALVMRVEIGLACRGLPSLDYLSKSDPYVVLFERLSVAERARGVKRPSTASTAAAASASAASSSPRTTPAEWREVGRTETIENNNDPNFKKHFIVQYRFEEIQELEFQIRDGDGGNKFDLVGVVQCRMSDLVRARAIQLERDIAPGGGPVSKKLGKLLLSTEPLQDNATQIVFRPEARSLEKMDFLGKSDPFFQIIRSDAANNLTTVYESEVIKKTLDPKWPRVSLPITNLCNADFDRTVIFRCFDWNSSGTNELIGEFRATLVELTGTRPPNPAINVVADSGPAKTFTLVRPLSKKNPTKPRGTFVLNDVRLTRDISFLDYVRGGMQISVMMAVDFTGSNGHPEDYNSLHYIKGPVPNAYQQAIEAIGNVVAPYDADQMFPMWGFGAIVQPHTNRVEHCFSMSQQPMVRGVAGMLEAYRNIVPVVTFSGPTYFAPTIQAAAAVVAGQPFNAHQQNYSVLVMITDGMINDVEETIDAVIAASHLPMSIIIVGVGDADFSSMKVLDGDDGLLRRAGKTAAHDIVQFVPFNQYRGNPQRLAAETLAEIPAQVVKFAQIAKVAPLPPPPHAGGPVA